LITISFDHEQLVTSHFPRADKFSRKLSFQ
jgi:hypothetical protein